MKVAMYYNNRDVRIEEMPQPQVSDGELLVKVSSSGICGSDVLEWYRVKKAPIVLGHEMAGQIDQVGKGVKEYKVGDRVFVAHHVPCNTCRYCLSGNHTVCETLHTTNYYPGGFCEYIRIPKINVERGTLKLSEGVSFQEGTFIEPLACVLRGQRMAQVTADKSLLILGAGISGLLHLLLVKACGVKKVFLTDINEYRLNFAKDFGASAVFNAKENLPGEIRELNENRLADVVIVCTGAISAFLQAQDCVERAGTILLFAATEPGVTLPVPVNDFWRKSIKIIHSYGSSPFDNAEALELLRLKKIPVEKMITHRLKLAEAALGFKLMSEGKDCLKVLLEP